MFKFKLTYNRFLGNVAERLGIIGPLEVAVVVKVDTLLHRVHSFLIRLPEEGSIQLNPHETLQDVDLFPCLEGKQTSTLCVLSKINP